MNAIDLLSRQHREVEELFEQLSSAEGDKAQDLFDDLADRLAVHAAIEEQHFYPVLLQGEQRDEVLEGIEEHLQIKRLIADLLDLTPDEENFKSKLEVLREEVDHHVQEEEGEIFPAARASLGAEQLDEIGERMEDLADEMLRQGAPRLDVPLELEEAPTA